MSMRFPPVMKLLIRGYIVMAFIVLVFLSGTITHTGLIIFSVTAVSIGMLFGVGILFMRPSRPVRKSSVDIPNTVLVFVKGAIVLYFVSLLGSFGILPPEIAGLLVTGTAFVLVIFGLVSYLLEVFERAVPVTPRSPRQRGAAPGR